MGNRTSSRPIRSACTLACVLLALPRAATAQSAAPSIEGLPIWSAEEDLVYGTGGQDGIGAVIALEVADDGLLYALDARNRQVLVFDAAGQPVRTVGALGTGPGEFQFPNDFGLLGDTLWVTDPGNGHMSLFSRRGEHLGDVPLSGTVVMLPGPVVVSLTPSRPLPDGTFASTPSVLREIGRALPTQADSARVPVLAFDGRGEVVDTLGWSMLQVGATTAPPIPFLVGWREFSIPDPFHELPLRAAAGGMRYAVDRTFPEAGTEGTFTIVAVQEGGAYPAYTRAYRYRPVPTDLREVGALIDELSGRIPIDPNTPRAEIERAIQGALEVPPFQAPVSAVRPAAGGKLWLRRNAAPGGRVRWTELDESGDPVREVHLPADVEPHVMSETAVWGIRRDPSGTFSVVRYALTRRALSQS